jgi:hypothetical protein
VSSAVTTAWQAVLLMPMTQHLLEKSSTLVPASSAGNAKKKLCGGAESRAGLAASATQASSAVAGGGRFAISPQAPPPVLSKTTKRSCTCVSPYLRLMTALHVWILGIYPQAKRRLDCVLLEISSECYDGCSDTRLTLHDLFMTYDLRSCMEDLGYVAPDRGLQLLGL